jgi:hypothetical protein
MPRHHRCAKAYQLNAILLAARQWLRDGLRKCLEKAAHEGGP